VPRYALWRYVYKAILAILAAIAAVLSSYDCTAFALIVSSPAAMVKSWIEFTDIGHKTERYTRAIIAIGNHLSFWKSLSEVEKASPVMIGNLVQTGENIISDERIAWQSTAQSKDQMDAERKSHSSKSAFCGPWRYVIAERKSHSSKSAFCGPWRYVIAHSQITRSSST